PADEIEPTVPVDVHQLAVEQVRSGTKLWGDWLKGSVTVAEQHRDRIFPDRYVQDRHQVRLPVGVQITDQGRSRQLLRGEDEAATKAPAAIADQQADSPGSQGRYPVDPRIAIEIRDRLDGSDRRPFADHEFRGTNVGHDPVGAGGSRVRGRPDFEVE